jgi:hypothetical protein
VLTPFRSFLQPMRSSGRPAKIAKMASCRTQNRDANR